MLWCGNAVSSVSTFARAAARFDLNLSKLKLGLAIDIASSSVGCPLLGACSAGGNACSFFSIVIGGLVVTLVVEVELGIVPDLQWAGWRKSSCQPISAHRASRRSMRGSNPDLQWAICWRAAST